MVILRFYNLNSQTILHVLFKKLEIINITYFILTSYININIIKA